MVEGFPGLGSSWVSYPVRLLSQSIWGFSLALFIDFLLQPVNGCLSFWYNQSMKGALRIFFRLLHPWKSSGIVRCSLPPGVSFVVRLLHSHHPVWSIAAPLLHSQPVPVYPGVPPFLILVSFGSLCNCVLLFASLPTVRSLIKLPLLRTRPSNHCLPVEVKLLVLFSGHGPYGYNDLTIIPVLALVPARLISFLATPRTWPLA